jgi:four helix bundle protein
MARPDLTERLLNYVVRIVKLVESLPPTTAGKRIGDQLLRSGTSSGANPEEAQAAESGNDFVHKLQIALKEIRESNYWLRVLSKSDGVSPERLSGLIDESNQLKAILSKPVATAKGKSKTKLEHATLVHEPGARIQTIGLATRRVFQCRLLRIRSIPQ